MSNFLIEGIDRLGKGTLIKGLKDVFGAMVVVHYQKPELLNVYLKRAADNLFVNVDQKTLETEALRLYQIDSFQHMFYMLDNSGLMVMDRAHLGETVYAKRYRGYDGNYVFELERAHPRSLSQDILILLTTSDMSIMQDDGQSLDFSKRQEEQEDFITAFYKSRYKTKVLIDVALDGGYAPAAAIINTVLDIGIGHAQKISFEKEGDNVVAVTEFL